jgi:hypothetical protein
VSGDGFDYHEDVLKPDKPLLLKIVVSASPSSRPEAIYMLALGNFMTGMLPFVRSWGGLPRDTPALKTSFEQAPRPGDASCRGRLSPGHSVAGWADEDGVAEGVDSSPVGSRGSLRPGGDVADLTSPRTRSNAAAARFTWSSQVAFVAL